MSITLESTSDTPEQIQSALGGEKPKPDAKPAEKSEVAEVTETDAAETADESETSEAEGEDTETESEDEETSGESEKKPKRKSGYQRKIEKLAKERAELRQERDFYREQAMKAQKPAEEKPQARESSKSNDAPDPSDFETHADYVRALVKHERAVEKAADDAKAREESVREKALKTESAFQERYEAFADANEEFEDALEAVNDIRMPFHVRDTLVESEVGPEVMFELAKNREEFERICSLSPLAAARAIGKIEARLGSIPSEEKPVKKTSAPAPLKPVGTKANIGPKKPEDMEHDEYRAWRAKNS